MCVQDIDVQCVLQFTLLHAAGCALHRHTSRVIHRLELYSFHRLWAAPYRHDFVRPKTTRAVSVGRQASDSNRTSIWTMKWLRGDVHLPPPHAGTALLRGTDDTDDDDGRRFFEPSQGRGP